MARKKRMEWVRFDRQKGSNQKLPSAYKPILMLASSIGPCMPEAIVVGYLKFAAGDKESPYFVSPGHGGNCIAWSDCLIDISAPRLWQIAHGVEI